MTDRRDWKDRELEILALLAQGLSDRAIATRLRISTETVRWYNKQIYNRLGVSNRTRAVHRAAALGLMDVAVPPAAQAPVDRSPVRYVDNGGVSIAWQTVGSGPVDLIFIHGFLSHLEVAWEDPEFTAFFEQLGRSVRVILFDKRGVGLSDRMQGAPSIEQTISDARHVLDAAGSQRAFVSGTSEGGAAAVLLASMHPERVRGLMLIGSTPVVVSQNGEPEWAVPCELFDQRISLLLATFGQPWALERFAPSRLHDETFQAWWSRVLRASASPSSVRSVLEQVRDIDIRPLLPQVRTRTVVVHRTDDRIVRVEAGRYLANNIPNAKLVELPGNDHIFFVDGAPVAFALTRFMMEPDAAPEIDTWIAIILCVSGSETNLTPEKREVLDACNTRQIHATRHSWMALFDAPNRAVQAARRLRELGMSRTPGMALHIGACSHADGPIPQVGEVVLRIASDAAPGEILVSGTLRDVLGGSGLHLSEHPFAGVESGTPIPAWSLVNLSG